MEKIDVLVNEKKNLRDEILTIKRIIYNSIFSVIAIIGGISAYFIGRDGFDEFLNSKHYVLYVIIICQIEFIISIFIFSLDSTIETISVYLNIIDDKINAILNERILFWESSRRLFNKTPKGAEWFCLAIIYVFFTIIFALGLLINGIEIFFNHTYSYMIFFLIQLIEALLLIILSIKKHQEFNKTKKIYAELSVVIQSPKNRQPNNEGQTGNDSAKDTTRKEETHI